MPLDPDSFSNLHQHGEPEPNESAAEGDSVSVGYQALRDKLCSVAEIKEIGFAGIDIFFKPGHI